MAEEESVLLDLLRPELPFWTNIISGYLDASDLYNVFCTCKSLSTRVEDEHFWRLRWFSFRPKLRMTMPPLGLQRWVEAHQHLALFRSPEQIQELGVAGLEKDLLSDVTCALHAESGLRAYGYSNGSVRVVLPSAAGGAIGHSAVQLHPSNVTTYALGSGSIRHMQLSEDGSTLYAGCWEGAVHRICITGVVPRRRASSTDEGGGSGSPSAPASARGAQDTEAEGPAALEALTNKVVAGMQGPIYALRLDRGVLYTCCGDGTIQAWDSYTGELVGTLEGHTAGVTDFCAVRLAVTSSTPPPSGLEPTVSPASRTQHLPLLISSSYDGTVRVWRSIAHTAAHRRKAHHAPLLTLRGHRGPVWTVAAEGTTVYSGSADGSVRVWTIAASQEETPVVGQDDPMRMLTGSCVAVLQHSGALVGTDILAADQFSSPAPSAQQGLGVGVVNGLNRKQIWCLKLFGPLVITGSSDGALSCWDTECLRSQIIAASSRTRVPRPSSEPLALAPAPAAAAAPAAACPNGTPAPSASATTEAGTPRAAVPVLLWNISGPGCDGLNDGVRRLDVVRNTIYTTTKHGNIGTARLLNQALALPRAYTAPAPGEHSGHGIQGSSAAFQTVTSFSSPAAETTGPLLAQPVATTANAPASGHVSPTASAGGKRSAADSNWDASSASASSADSRGRGRVPCLSSLSLSPMPSAGILSSTLPLGEGLGLLSDPCHDEMGAAALGTGMHSLAGHAVTRGSRASSDASRVSSASGLSSGTGGGGGESLGALLRLSGPGSPHIRGKPPPSPVRVGSGPCSNMRV